MTLLRSSRAVLLRLAMPVALLPCPVHLLSKPAIDYSAGGSLKLNVTYSQNVHFEPMTSYSSCSCFSALSTGIFIAGVVHLAFGHTCKVGDGKNDGTTQA